MSKDKYIITQIVNRKPIPIPTTELKEDGMFLSIHENIISQIIEANNNREFEFVCSQIQNFIEENNIGVCFAINKNELIGCLQEHQRLKLEIADLEAKVAESEENCFDLQQRLTDKEEQCRECKHLNKRIELNIKNKLLIENEELKQKLAEKEADCEDAEQCAIDFQNRNTELEFEIEDLNSQISQLYDVNKEINQDKISFAVEQLEKARSNILCNEKFYFENLNKYIDEQLDNQIKQLKGVK